MRFPFASTTFDYRYPEDNSEHAIDHRPEQLEAQSELIATTASAVLVGSMATYLPGTSSAMRAALVVRSFQIGCY
jgi:hypothetical protein